MPKDNGRLHKKMLETIEVWGEQIKLLNETFSTMNRYKDLNQPVPSELFNDIRDISIDMLEFLDYADQYSMDSARARCMIQDYLEICETKGLYGK